jgi:hypothetical protein
MQKHVERLGIKVKPRYTIIFHSRSLLHCALSSPIATRIADLFRLQVSCAEDCSSNRFSEQYVGWAWLRLDEIHEILGKFEHNVARIAVLLFDRQDRAS